MVYRVRPACSEFELFEHIKNKPEVLYDSGERLANFENNRRGRLYYRSGRLALDYYNEEESNDQQRFVVYSSGEPDERGKTHPITILSTFDYNGNGIVFDHSGKIRLKFNQTKGVILDRGIGPVSNWKWHIQGDPPALQQVMINTQISQKDTTILELDQAQENSNHTLSYSSNLNTDEDILLKEHHNAKKANSNLTQIKPFQIKMKSLKINEHFSLKILDQASVYLIFKDGTMTIKLNVGMVLDHEEIVDSDTADGALKSVSDSASFVSLQRSVAYAQQYEAARSNGNQRIRRPEPASSGLKRVMSLPLRPPLTLVSSKDSTSDLKYCRFKKPNSNLYYNSRLI